MMDVARKMAAQAAAAARKQAGGLIPGHGPASPYDPYAPGTTGAGIPNGAAPLGWASADAPSSSGVTVNVDMSGSTVREEADISKIGADIGFRLMSHHV
ncbi:hypothetical protein E1267_00265 [Nonomuraea longispora]|uniref:Uncharacterized protein n=1 Tax=Nonomuraea longispora TaxID=1848320 RepID=A0A4R4NQ73_9ACTN|nr:hypothetical protein [Nonomuraea longispora]TDC11419.1 hypothetical protein E1267_00265 [Nonomuraea longispora]